MNNKEWQWVVQWVTKNDSEWKRLAQRMTASGTTSYNEWERMRVSKVINFRFQNETKRPTAFLKVFYSSFYVMYSYYFYHTSLTSYFSLSVLLKLLKHAKRISKRVFTWDFISDEMKYFWYGVWAISYNCLHEITQNKNHYECYFIAFFMTKIKFHFGS